MIITNFEAIVERFPGAQITVRGGEITDWPSGIPRPTQAQIDTWEAAYASAKKTGVLQKAVTAERDRRIAAGMVFQGHTVQTRPDDLRNIQGSATLAGFAIGAGAQPGDYLWAGSKPFAWIMADNSTVPMDAQTMLELGKAVAARTSALIFDARALKDTNPIPMDYTADKHWPV